MDESSKRRVGRPKATPQAGPLVLGASKKRVKIDIELVGATAEELKAYSTWVELSSGLGAGEALATTVEFALRDTFRRDRLWQEKRRKGIETPHAPSAAAPKLPSASPSDAARCVVTL